MDLFSQDVSDWIGRDDRLTKVKALMDWGRFSPILKRGLGRSGIGLEGYDPLILFRCLLIGQWHGLSDPKLECALKVRLDFMIFCGLDLNTPVPDETTPWRFPNSLVKGMVYDDLLAEVCPHLEVHVLKLKQAQGAILDGTLVQSPTRPCRFIDTPNDREEGEKAEPEGGITYSADPDAPWVKKGAKSTLGFKGFARCDEEGFVDRVHTTPANRGESLEFETLARDAKARRILAGKAYAFKANRAFLKGKHRNGIMRKAARARPLRASEKRFNKLISKSRFRSNNALAPQNACLDWPELDTSAQLNLTPNSPWLPSDKIFSKPPTKSPSTAKPPQSHKTKQINNPVFN